MVTPEMMVKDPEKKHREAVNGGNAGARAESMKSTMQAQQVSRTASSTRGKKSTFTGSKSSEMQRLPCGQTSRTPQTEADGEELHSGGVSEPQRS